MQTLEEAQKKVRARCKQTPPLKWKRLNDYSLVSACGQFYIGKAIVMGETRYDVWFKGSSGVAMQLRMNLPTADDARVWASSIANSYRKGEMTLRAPPTLEEIQRLKEVVKEVGRPSVAEPRAPL